MNLSDSVIEIHQLETRVQEAWVHFLDEHQDELLKNIIQIAKLKCQGRTENRSEMRIEFGIKDASIDDLKQEKYPASHIKWSIYKNNSIWIECSIEAYFRGELDDSVSISFPADEAEYNKYIAKLEDAAHAREYSARIAKEKKLLDQLTEATQQTRLIKEELDKLTLDKLTNAERTSI